MRTITPPQLNAANWLDQIMQAKHNPRRGRLAGMRAALLARYAVYRQHAADLSALPQRDWTAAEHGDCCHCYEEPTAPSKRLESRLKRAAQRQTGGFAHTAESTNTTRSTITHHVKGSPSTLSFRRTWFLHAGIATLRRALPG